MACQVAYRRRLASPFPCLHAAPAHLSPTTDDAPLRRFVTRTHSFDQVDFDALIQNPDLYTVHNAAGAGLSPRHYASATPPTGVKQPVVLNRPRRSSGERPRSKSVLGMPTFRPDSTFYKYWSSLILALDLTYSAFVVGLHGGVAVGKGFTGKGTGE